MEPPVLLPDHKVPLSTIRFSKSSLFISVVHTTPKYQFLFFFIFVTFYCNSFLALLFARLSLRYQLNKNEQENKLLNSLLCSFISLFNMNGVNILHDDVHNSGRKHVSSTSGATFLLWTVKSSRIHSKQVAGFERGTL
jgi:hypothetical protein